MRSLKAIVVEDEAASLRNLVWKIEQHCPEIEIIDSCMKGKVAIDKIKHFRPDVVFLDVHLDGMTGFDVLEAVPYTRFDVIFVTDYNEYAIRAVKQQALDYLLKPVRPLELEMAVARLVEKHRHMQPRTDRIGLPVATGEKIFRLQDILYLEAQNNRCRAFLTGAHGNIDIQDLTRPLGHMEQQLTRFGFGRPNQTFLVNLLHITEYIRKDGGWIVMSDTKPINISARFRDDFHQFRRDWEIPS
jgi:two-component system LytT family response regulator